jgi:ectoine hydroxylase-related dioxygenase (phytanoyl-CoA dioxygenase family)
MNQDDYKQLFDRQGYVAIKGLLDAAHIATLSAAVDRIHRQWLEQNRAEYVERQLVNMHSLTSRRYFDGDAAGRIAFFDSIAPANLTALIDRMFGNDIYFHNTQLFFNPFENRRLPYWHRDMQYSPVDDAAQAREQRNIVSLHIRIPLLKESGVELIPGSHKRWDTELENDVRFRRNGHQDSEDLPGAALISLHPGDVLIFDAQMLHRGNYRLNAARKALDLCVGKPHPFTSQYLDENVLPDQREMDDIRNNVWYRRAREVVTNRNTPGGQIKLET